MQALGFVPVVSKPGLDRHKAQWRGLKHRADFHSRFSLRENTRKRYFRGAKGDNKSTDSQLLASDVVRMPCIAAALISLKDFAGWEFLPVLALPERTVEPRLRR